MTAALTGGPRRPRRLHAVLECAAFCLAGPAAYFTVWMIFTWLS